MGKYIKYVKLDTSTKPEDLPEIDFSTEQVADLLGCHPETIRRHTREGKLKSIKAYNGWNNLYSRELVAGLIAHRSDRLYITYTGEPLPHLRYLMYLMLERRNNRTAIKKIHQRYRLPLPPRAALDQLWETLMEMVSPSLQKVLNRRRGPMGEERAAEFDKLVNALGIAPLFDEIAPMCESVLLDHSRARIGIEVLITGRVSLEEIQKFIHKRWSKFYTVEELAYFQLNFYNVTEFTFVDFRRYISLLNDAEERSYKMESWNNPLAAKLKVGVPIRAQYEQWNNRAAAVAMKVIDEFIANPEVGTKDAFAAMDKLSKMFNDDLKGKDRWAKDADAEAGRQAKGAEKNITIKQKREEPVMFEDLNQEAPKQEEEKPKKASKAS